MPVAGKPGEGAYRSQVHHAADGLWCVAMPCGARKKR